MLTPIYKKGQKEDPGNYRPVILTSVPGKIMVRFLLSVLPGHVKDNKGIRPIHHGFMKCRSSLTSLISFYEEIDDMDFDIQIEDPLFIRKLRFIPLQSCPLAPAHMLVP